MAQRRRRWLIFVDTNILLDFYRLSGDSAERHLKALERHRDALILTNQVWMEFLKNRQKVILTTLKDMKRPEKITYPPIVAGFQQAKMVANHLKRAEKSSEWVKRKIQSVLGDPATHDFVYQHLNKLFDFKGPYVLDRTDKTRYTIRSLARKRFVLGYPPRKDSDTSIGDSINWEWIIRCAESSPPNFDILIVSRDNDYGSTQGSFSYLNDWLAREFKARVSRKRKVKLTPRLTAALKLLEEQVTPEDEKEEAAIAEMPVQVQIEGPITLEEWKVFLRELSPKASAGERYEALLKILAAELV